MPSLNRICKQSSYVILVTVIGLRFMYSTAVILISRFVPAVNADIKTLNCTFTSSTFESYFYFLFK